MHKTGAKRYSDSQMMDTHEPRALLPDTNLPSDVAHVCDWTNVSDVGLPHCYKATCPGHRADDMLEQSNFLNRGDTCTLSEFYEFLSPFNTDLPYVYDSFTQWPGCTAEGIDLV